MGGDDLAPNARYQHHPFIDVDLVLLIIYIGGGPLSQPWTVNVGIAGRQRPPRRVPMIRALLPSIRDLSLSVGRRGCILGDLKTCGLVS